MQHAFPREAACAMVPSLCRREGEKFRLVEVRTVYVCLLSLLARGMGTVEAC